VDVFTADMSSQAEVRRLASEVIDAYPRLDVLVNNVGGFWAHRHVTADGLEDTFALNHVGPFLLTNMLPDRLKASAPARVVTVSSGRQLWMLPFRPVGGVTRPPGAREVPLAPPPVSSG
jgi:NAD(P)-dependent dehydrogenase (short-subunit alcohol dehydrogenase family)